MSGWWDFYFHMLKPEVIGLLGEPFEKTALEIGYGAGRLLVPACHFFRHCVGIDIHPYRKKVEELMRQRGATNFTLYETDGYSIPLEDDSIDFIYSFIVLQHLPTIDSLRKYLEESNRVLRHNSVAILYMGYLPGRFRKRYVDLQTRSVSTVRQVTLQLTIPLALTLLRNTGFQVVDCNRSQKKPWRVDLGGQFYCVVKK